MKNSHYTKEDISPLKELKENFRKLLLSYKEFYSRTERKPTKLISEYGEILVQLELLNKFWIELPGGQSKADLVIVNKKDDSKRNVEIKTSSYKKEEPGEGWGFALNNKLCKEHKKRDFCYFNYIICICLDKDYSPEFYIITKEEIEEHELELTNSKSGRFKASSHGLWIPVKPSEKNKLSNFELKLYKNKDFLGRWNKIKISDKI